jgi:hypothetical protein
MRPVPVFVPKIFDGPPWQQLGPRKYGVKIESVISAAVTATLSPSFGQYGLNCRDIDSLRQAVRDDKVKQAFIVAARMAAKPVYKAGVWLEDFELVLGRLPTRDGKFGPFWVIDPIEFGLGEEWVIEEI